MPASRINTRTAALIGSGLAAAGAVAVVTYQWGLRPWYERWGATESEVSAVLPGDELVPQPKYLRTKAVTVQAPVGQVWPWLLQMGQDKAGLYSYEVIENRLLGCAMHNSDRLVPEWQNIQVGDPVRLFPADKQGPPPYVIALIEAQRALVMGHKDEAGQWFDSWQFVLQPVDGHTTRLVHRVRGGSMGIWDALQWAYFIMERRDDSGREAARRGAGCHAKLTLGRGDARLHRVSEFYTGRYIRCGHIRAHAPAQERGRMPPEELRQWPT